jgi:hypothetical protein
MATYWQDAVRRLAAEGRPFDITMEQAREFDARAENAPPGPGWFLGDPPNDRQRADFSRAGHAKAQKLEAANDLRGQRKYVPHGLPKRNRFGINTNRPGSPTPKPHG